MWINKPLFFKGSGWGGLITAAIALSCKAQDKGNNRQCQQHMYDIALMLPYEKAKRPANDQERCYKK